MSERDVLWMGIKEYYLFESFQQRRPNHASLGSPSRAARAGCAFARPVQGCGDHHRPVQQGGALHLYSCHRWHRWLQAWRFAVHGGVVSPGPRALPVIKQRRDRSQKAAPQPLALLAEGHGADRGELTLIPRCAVERHGVNQLGGVRPGGPRQPRGRSPAPRRVVRSLAGPPPSPLWARTRPSKRTSKLPHTTKPPDH